MIRAEGLAKPSIPKAVVRRAFGSRQYLAYVLGGLLLAFVLIWRQTGIFACPGGGYVGDGYLAYCQADAYGDYDHGAVWFALQPDVIWRAANADVLFLGNSRLQFALSSAATTNWFAAEDKRFYLLGFGQTENVQFVAPLLDRIRPRARAYVVNVDRFFNHQHSKPAAAIMQNPDALERYRTKGRWQIAHEAICDNAAALCGNHVSFYRDAANGSWTRRGTEAQFRQSAVVDATIEDPLLWQDHIDLAEAFVASLPVAKECVVLMLAPYHGTKRREANTIAAALGMPLISPQLDALTTFDESHLDPPSAERWSEAFFAAAGPTLLRCVNTISTGRVR